ncbi:hypothetical protein PFISCL1PPCAC_22402 [Pristionchus fissidentatus]|uniref:Uncharacterized protein n=1 Tax=Pristionchus fissidentatus TaxID=1538716 RepID=A0AAV5WKP3_9BILA|nr:hypothetical protein PFISCL1PPCAC_22402 [Pristionchus fissidentatus]
MRAESGVLKRPGRMRKVKEEKPIEKKSGVSKQEYLEDVIAFIYSRLDHNEKPLVHKRVCELRHRSENPRNKWKLYCKRSRACEHRKKWIASPISQEPVCVDENDNWEEVEVKVDDEDSESDQKIRSNQISDQSSITSYTPQKIYRNGSRVAECAK